MIPVSRRSMAGAAGLLLLAAPVKATKPDDTLLHLVEEFVAHIAVERAILAVMTPEEQGVFHQARFVDTHVHGNRSPTEAMARVIARVPAQTQDGIKAKARALLWLHGGSDAGPLFPIGDGLWESLLADMTGTPCRLPVSRPADAEDRA